MAYPNDMSRIAEALGRLEAADSAAFTNNPKVAARNLIRPTFTLQKVAADAMASTATAYTAADSIIYVTRAFRLVEAKFVTGTAIAADNTDFCTIKVVKGDGAGGGEVIAASGTTKAADMNGPAAGVVAALTLSATLANTRFPRGSVLSFSIAKAGAGKVVGPSTFSVTVEWEDVDANPV